MNEEVFDKPVNELTADQVLERISWYCENYRGLNSFTIELIRDVCEEWLDSR